MTPKYVAIEPEILKRAGRIAEAEGKTVDELATEALRRDLARRWLERTRREAEARRGDMTEEEGEAIVEKAIRESRAEQRGRRWTGSPRIATSTSPRLN